MTTVEVVASVGCFVALLVYAVAVLIASMGDDS